jgi:hypothetical protein
LKLLAVSLGLDQHLAANGRQLEDTLDVHPTNLPV